MKSPLIDALFGSAIKAKIVQWLYVEADPSQGYSVAELVRRTGVPMSSLPKALHQLVDQQLVVKVPGPLGNLYRAPHEDPRLKGLFLFLRQDSEIIARLRRSLKKVKSVRYACVFGSFARGTTHLNSDIDVLVLESGESDTFAIFGACSKLGDQLGRPVNPQIYSVEEFTTLIQEANPLALSFVSDRIDLIGDTPWPT